MSMKDWISPNPYHMRHLKPENYTYGNQIIHESIGIPLPKLIPVGLNEVFSGPHDVTSLESAFLSYEDASEYP